jgi:hypothetical protein
MMLWCYCTKVAYILCPPNRCAVVHLMPETFLNALNAMPDILLCFPLCAYMACLFVLYGECWFFPSLLILLLAGVVFTICDPPHI